MTKQITVKFEMKLFTKKRNGIILGDMTVPVVYLNWLYSEAFYDGVLLCLAKNGTIT
jgi:hypothetical protein